MNVATDCFGLIIAAGDPEIRQIRTNNSILRCAMIPISYLCGVFVISGVGVTNLCVPQTLLGGIDI